MRHATTCALSQRRPTSLLVGSLVVGARSMEGWKVVQGRVLPSAPPHPPRAQVNYRRMRVQKPPGGRALAPGHQVRREVALYAWHRKIAMPATATEHAVPRGTRCSCRDLRRLNLELHGEVVELLDRETQGSVQLPCLVDVHAWHEAHIGPATTAVRRQASAWLAS